MRIRTIALSSAVLVAAGLVIGTALGNGKPGLAAEQCDLDDGVREPDLRRRAHARP